MKGNYNFPALVKELLSSPLVTGAAATTTFPADSNGNETVPVSIARQAHLCAALSNRMGISDICALQAAVPTSAQNDDADHRRQRGGGCLQPRSQTPVTPAFPDLFYRAASEELCENVAKLVVDVTGGPYTSSSTSCADGDGLITKFVEQVMGINPSDSVHGQAHANSREPLRAGGQGQDHHRVADSAAAAPAAPRPRRTRCGRRSCWPASPPPPSESVFKGALR